MEAVIRSFFGGACKLDCYIHWVLYLKKTRKKSLHIVSLFISRKMSTIKTRWISFKMWNVWNIPASAGPHWYDLCSLVSVVSNNGKFTVKVAEKRLRIFRVFYGTQYIICVLGSEWVKMHYNTFVSKGLKAAQLVFGLASPSWLTGR